jgi:hypothetical protein
MGADSHNTSFHKYSFLGCGPLLVIQTEEDIAMPLSQEERDFPSFCLLKIFASHGAEKRWIWVDQ